jgi:hypothetical protein
MPEKFAIEMDLEKNVTRPWIEVSSENSCTEFRVLEPIADGIRTGEGERSKFIREFITIFIIS